RNVALDIVQAVYAADAEVELDEAVFAGDGQPVPVDDRSCRHGFVEEPAFLDFTSRIGGEKRLFVDVEPEKLLALAVPEGAFAQLAFAVDKKARGVAHALAPLS